MMSKSSGFIKARSHIIFIIGLLLAFSIVWAVEKNSIMPISSTTIIKTSATLPTLPMPRALTEQERNWAEIAWVYFVNNTQPSGLINSVQNYPSTTMWDTASSMMAIISAYQIGLISQFEFDERINKMLQALNLLTLFDNALPNKSYNTRSLNMTDYNNNPLPQGLGWSAIDIGRLIIPLNIIIWRYPQHAPQISQLLARWQLSRLVKNGELYGAHRAHNGKTIYPQEGRLGYEQYAGRALQLVGIDSSVASSFRYLTFATVEGIPVGIDSRPSEPEGAQSFIVSEPYVLNGIELPPDLYLRELSWRILQAQQARWQETGIFTAVSEDHVDRNPYFIYNTLLHNKEPWVTITEKGNTVNALRQLSTKAAFAWYALFDTNYTQQLRKHAAELSDPKQGWYAGRYEIDNAINKTLTANTNAVILESLAFIQNGPLLCVSCSITQTRVTDK